MIKRFWAFHAPTYYPECGMLDKHASFDAQEEAEAWLVQTLSDGEGDAYFSDGGHIWDMLEDRQVSEFEVVEKTGEKRTARKL